MSMAVELDPNNPAFLALVAQRLEDLTVAVRKMESLRQDVGQNTLKISTLEKDNSGHHKAARDTAAFTNKVEGGMKIIFIVFGLSQAIFLLVGGAMFTAYVRGETARQAMQDQYTAINQRIDDLRQDVDSKSQPTSK